MEKTCAICGATFETNRSDKKICSPDCRAALTKLNQANWRRERLKDPAYRERLNANKRKYLEKHKYDLEWHERRNARAREEYRRKHT